MRSIGFCTGVAALLNRRSWWGRRDPLGSSLFSHLCAASKDVVNDFNVNTVYFNICLSVCCGLNICSDVRWTPMTRMLGGWISLDLLQNAQPRYPASSLWGVASKKNCHCVLLSCTRVRPITIQTIETWWEDSCCKVKPYHPRKSPQRLKKTEEQQIVMQSLEQTLVGSANWEIQYQFG